jgi:hypothetical protein
MSLLNVDKVDPSTGTTLTLGTSGDTVSIPSGVTIANSGTATGFGTTINNNADNRVITGSDSANTLEGEANLTFSAGTLAVNGGATFQNDIDLGEYNITNVGTVSCDGLLADTTNMTINSDDASGVLTLQTNSNTALYIDSTGAITKPLQPAFLAISNAENNVTGNGTVYTMLWAKSEPIDQNADFASGTFTAPVTGTYMFGVNMQMNSMSGLSYSTLKLVTSNREYNRAGGVYVDGSNLVLAQYADMDASDTAYVTIQVGGLGGDTADIGVDSSFYGWLVA